METPKKLRVEDAMEAARFAIMTAARGEQPDVQAMPADRALRGDIPRSSSSESEEQ